MGERHYISAPVSGEEIQDWFEHADDRTPISKEEAEQIALRAINEAIFRERSALWLNPETDRGRSGAKVFGQPLVVDGKPVRYVPTEEAAIFPPREVA